MGLLEDAGSGTIATQIVGIDKLFRQLTSVVKRAKLQVGHPTF